MVKHHFTAQVSHYITIIA